MHLCPPPAVGWWACWRHCTQLTCSFIYCSEWLESSLFLKKETANKVYKCQSHLKVAPVYPERERERNESERMEGERGWAQPSHQALLTLAHTPGFDQLCQPRQPILEATCPPEGRRALPFNVIKASSSGMTSERDPKMTHAEAGPPPETQPPATVSQKQTQTAAIPSSPELPTDKAA